jgi:DNA (cytosine-5)-methyltransferase 1
MIHASLFSGIGGFDLAAEWMGWENLFHCEWNPFGQQVLKHHFPNSISYNDITKTDFSIHRGQVDILTGGFPCQPYSSAGKRLGNEDERHLWPEMLRTIQEVQPRWVVGENVLGLTNWNGGLVFNEVQVDLEAKGYEVQAFILPACAKNAPHRRDRVWFVAYSNLYNDKRKVGSIDAKEKRISKEYRKEYSPSREFSGTNIQDVTNTNKIGFSTKMGNGELGGELGFTKRDEQNMWNSFPTQPPICGGNDGLPTELDSISLSKYRKESLMAYGNAIVPQVAYEIFKAINEFELMVNK